MTPSKRDLVGFCLESLVEEGQMTVDEDGKYTVVEDPS